MSRHRCVLLAIMLVVGSLTLAAAPASAAVLSGRAVSPTSAYLEWTPECLSGPLGAPCGGYKTAGYAVYMKNGSFQASWLQIESISNVVVTNDTVIGLQSATTYQFYVLEELAGFWSGSIQSNIITLQTPPLPDVRPSIAITSPVAGQSYTAGTAISLEWTLSDDHDSPENLVIYLNYTGPSSGSIAGPLSGRTTHLVWTIPLSLIGSGYRVTAITFDMQLAWRATESPEFTVTGSPGIPPGGPWVWVFSTGILSALSSVLVAALLLAFRVQLSEWYRRTRERRRQRQAPPR